jgi:hypothetical protein
MLPKSADPVAAFMPPRIKLLLCWIENGYVSAICKNRVIDIGDRSGDRSRSLSRGPINQCICPQPMHVPKRNGAFMARSHPP